VGGAPTGAPQAEQNRAPSGSSAPHRRQPATSDEPHEAQNRAPSGFPAPQLAHVCIGRV
jgi:hypothetical protein